MLAKRIIPCLDVRDGRTVKGINFVQLRDAGDPVELGKAYAENGADELTFLDITATVEKRSTFVELVKRISENVNIPFTVGGGISTIAHVSALLNAGADKITVNTAAVHRPELVTELAGEFGSQCTVVAVDCRLKEGVWRVATHGGRTITDIPVLEWVKEVYNRGAGEILLTSMENDGTKAGFAIELTRLVSEMLPIPVIASGGAGTMEHFTDVFREGKADAALAASIFHFGEIPLMDLKKYLANQGIAIRL